MALDTTTLKLIMKSGNDKEKRQASKIYPLRKRGNLLLCTLVLGNVLVNNTLTIVLDTLTGSMYAVLMCLARVVSCRHIAPAVPLYHIPRNPSVARPA
jgi:metal transporter CNNM